LYRWQLSHFLPIESRNDFGIKEEPDAKSDLSIA
jgi:hypothetical protein